MPQKMCSVKFLRFDSFIRTSSGLLFVGELVFSLVST